MEWYETAFDRYYPILYSHRDDGEAARAVSTYSRYLDGNYPILDLASGGGRYLSAMSESGYAAFGLDLSMYLLQESLSRPGVPGRVLQGDMRVLPFADGTFGSVINMFTSFGYFQSDTDNLIVFREVARVLRMGGVFLFDFINAEHISSSLLERSSRETTDFDIEERRNIVDYGKYLVKHVQITNRKTGERDSFDERLRLYTRDDLTTMLESVDLRPAGIFGDYEGNPFVDGVSERTIIVSEKS